MKLVVFALVLFTTRVFGQAGDFLLGTSLDIAKTGNDGHFQRMQGGGELNYWITNAFTATAGIEAWTREGISYVAGARWYPVPEAFARFRGIIGANDVALGGGWVKPLKNNWRFEAMADLYFAGHIAIRAGLAYRIEKK